MRFEMVVRGMNRGQPLHILRSAPAVQSIGRKRDGLRTRIYRCCIPGRCLDVFRKSNSGLSLCPRNYTGNRRANTMFPHPRRRLLFRAARTSAYYRILSGFPACQSAAQSIGSTCPDNNCTAIDRRECLFDQVESFLPYVCCTVLPGVCQSCDCGSVSVFAPSFALNSHSRSISKMTLQTSRESAMLKLGQ